MKGFAALSFVTHLTIAVHMVSGHGYMKSPRARNLRAYEDGVWWGGTENDPKPEDCPHCLNLGGSLARCGMTGGRNYDHPMNSEGGPLPWNIESQYSMGSTIDIETVITAHHKGHIEIKACPLDHPGQVASQSCFDSHPLEFVFDELYGAPKDDNYPGRAYLAPKGIAQSDHSEISGLLYKFKFQLPNDVSGQVLLQWYYITGNSCTAEGYNEYSFPTGWETSAAVCDNIPDDGIGVPEQFWNCGEVYVGNDAPPSLTPTTETSSLTASPSTTKPRTNVPTPNPTIESTLGSNTTTDKPTMAPSSLRTTTIPTSWNSPSERQTHAPTSRSTPPNSGDALTKSPTSAPSLNDNEYENESNCPNEYTGLVSSDTCTHFQHCVSGVAVGGYLPCPDGLLFDVSLQVCNYNDSVLCNGTPPLEEVCLDNPNGMVAVDNCTGFRYCSGGLFSSPKQSCSAGLLFDASIKVCNWSSLVTCGPKGDRSLRGTTG